MKLLVLGGGSCQLNLIKRAKQMGHEVIVADYLADCPGRGVADNYVPVSTFDIEGVLEAARKLKIEGITTLGTDQPVLTAAVIAEELGLHFYIDSKTAQAVTNKRVMKRLFEENKIPCVPYRLIGKEFVDNEISGLKFPCVLKPVDSQGQRGVLLVKSVAEARERIAETLSYSREDKALIEEYYESDEITVNGWAESGKFTMLSVVDRVTIRGTEHIGVCLCHNFPSLHLNSRYDEIEELTRTIISAFGIENGPVYFQYLIGREGIKVNEIAMRIGGAYEDMTIPLISGIDILGMTLEYAEKGRCDTSALNFYVLRANKKYMSTQLFFCRAGRVTNITPVTDILALPFVHDAYISYKEGDVVPNMENATARAGYMIVEGNSFSDMTSKVGAAFERLKLLDSDGNNLVIKYQDYDKKYLFAEEG